MVTDLLVFVVGGGFVFLVSLGIVWIIVRFALGSREQETGGTDAMNLQEFITETLASIARGIEGAIEEVGDIAIINPPTGDFLKDEPYGSYRRLQREETSKFPNLIHKIEFDVAVTAEKEGGTSGKARIGIAVVSAEIGGEGTLKSSSVSRVKFDVPMVLPASPDRKELYRRPQQISDVQPGDS